MDEVPNNAPNDGVGEPVADFGDILAVAPAGPLPAWRYAPHQKSPMMIADVLAALSQIHQTALNESLAEDRLTEQRVASNTLVAKFTGNEADHKTGKNADSVDAVIALSPAMPMAAAEYAGVRENPVPPEPHALAIDMNDAAELIPVRLAEPMLPRTAMPLPAAAYALQVPDSVQAVFSKAENPVGVPVLHLAPDSNAETQAAPRRMGIAPAVAIDEATRLALAHAAAAATSPAQRNIDASRSALADGARREINILEHLLTTPLGAENVSPKFIPEAHITIRRAEEAMMAAPRHVPDTYDRQLSSSRQAAGVPLFDAGNYAAYRERIEEASVDIVSQQPAASMAAAATRVGGSGRREGWPASLVERLMKALVRQ